MSSSTHSFFKLLQSETSMLLHEKPISNHADLEIVEDLLELVEKIIAVELVKRDLSEEDLTKRVIDFIKSTPPEPVDPIYQ